MNMSRLARLAVAALVLTAPVASFADSASAMDACLATFLNSDLAKDRKVTVLKDVDSKPLPLSLSGAYKIEVVAKGRESGKELAHIVCHADKKGTILAVNGRPATAAASLASSR
jgi:hypothetical protein